MPLSREQKGLLHIAPARLGVDEPTRRLVQRNVGGAESAAQMGYAGYCRVMAYWENSGWRHDRLPADHFRRLAATDPRYRLRGKACSLAVALGWTEQHGRADDQRLDAFVLRQTGGRIGRLAACDADELFAVIEGLKAMLRRAPSQETSSPSGLAAVDGSAARPRAGAATAMQPPHRRPTTRCREGSDGHACKTDPPVA